MTYKTLTKTVISISLVIACFSSALVYAQSTKDTAIDDFLKKYKDDLEKLNPGDTGGNGAAYEFVRNGIYGCKGIGEVGPVGLQHAQGTFVPVSEEAIALNTFILVNKFCVLDGLNIRQREALVAGLTRAGLRQINEGRQGRSKYEGNWKQLMRREIPDAVMEKMLEHESMNKICGPFKENVKRSLVQAYVNATRKQDAAFTCNYPGTEEEQRKALSGDLESVGWSGWRATLDAGNNEFDAFLSLRDIADATIRDEQERYQTELNWGNGFHSDKECRQVAVGNGEFEEQCEVVTPGKVIADMTSFLSQTGHRQTEQADSIDELLGSFITNLQTEVLSSFSGLQGTTNNTSGASYLDRAVDDAFGRARGETTNVGKDALSKALATETEYNAIIKTTLALIDSTISALAEREDKCFADMLAQAKKDLKKQVEDEACTDGLGDCTADVTEDITDDPSSTETNPKKRYKITASIGSTRKTVTLLKTNAKTLEIVKNDIEPIRKVYAQQLKDSDVALNVLKGLDTMIKNDSSPATAQFVIQKLEQLLKGGKLHNSAHVSNARDKQSQLRDILQNLVQRTETAWENTWCKAEKWQDLTLK
ncbi:MAG: hypothetical protein RI911_405 [Candidatus Parcubacteria bacterium]|jgi:hypothetical protein